MSRKDEVNWSIDDTAVTMDGSWTCNMVAPGGYDRFSGTILAAGLPWIGQKSVITGYRPGKGVLWSGELAASPKLRDEGRKLSIVASGPRVNLMKKRARLPYQLRDYSQLSLISGEPYLYTSGTPAINDSIQFSTQPGLAQWTIPDTTTVATGDVNPAAWWVPGNALSGYGLIIRTQGGTANWKLRIYTATGPSGSLTNVLDQSLAGAPPITIAFTALSTSDDMFVVSPYRSGGPGATVGDYWIRCTQLRANYLAAADSMSPSDLVGDVFARAGFDTVGVGASGANALPQDWSGSGWDGFLDYMATLDDWVWLAQEDRGRAQGQTARGWAGDYQPWGLGLPAWGVATEKNAIEELDPQELFNRIVIGYTSAAGAPAEVTLDADPDPLINPRTGQRYVNEWFESLSDPQPDDTLPKAVANNRLPYLSAPRVVGRLSIGELEGQDGPVSPLELKAGHLVNVRDYRPPLVDQRVVGVTYRPYGPVEADIGMDVSSSGLIARYALRRERR